ncbi:MAG: 1-acyl-sn-glycerol-3-phosphate acyltransferase [Deltaproteobacteria bacterium]
MSLFDFNLENKGLLLEKVVRRVYDEYLSISEDRREQLLLEMIYWEKKRQDRVKNRFQKWRKIRYWEKYEQSYLQGSSLERQRCIHESIEHYANQIVGNFSPLVYQAATKIIPPFLNLLFNALSFRRIVSLGSSLSSLGENLIISGDISWVKRLAGRGTLIWVPTHVSNFDSIILGTVFHYTDLPPVMYGAGLNLFYNKFIGFFMKNLGAYKVDRLRAHQIYKDVLKEYATTSIEMGFHNLFFPGGTRSRSGAVEKKLKLGLVGSGLRAYIRNLQTAKKNPNIYIIPVTINAHLTLEAETLIDDFLGARGQSRYIIENDEFSSPMRLFSYLKSHIHLNSKTFVHLAAPLDPFGNRVDEQGSSIDHHGRLIDISRYVLKDGHVEIDEERDRNYTSELGNVLIDSYHRKNRVLSTNLVAFTLYEMIAGRHPDFDIYKLLRTHAYGEPIELRDVYRTMDRVIAELRQLDDQGRIVYDLSMRSKDTQDILNEALKIFASYHRRKTVDRVGDKIYVGDLLLLYYYHNRLIGYNLEDMMRGIK